MKKRIFVGVTFGVFAAATLLPASQELAIFLADASDQTLIICTLITMFGVLITALVALYGIRISQSNAKALLLVSALPEQVKELSKGIDGVAHELKAAKEEGTVAKVEAARAQGQLEERDRNAAVTPAAVTPGAAPVDVIVRNKKDDAANVKLS